MPPRTRRRLHHTRRSAHCREVKDGASRTRSTPRLPLVPVAETRFPCSQGLAPAPVTWGGGLTAEQPPTLHSAQDPALVTGQA